MFSIPPIVADRCQMGDNGQYHKCHIQECGIGHSMSWWIHPCYVSADGACYERDGAYWSGCTNFHLIFQVFPKKGSNQSSLLSPPTVVVYEFRIVHILSLEYLRNCEYNRRKNTKEV